MGTFFFHGKIWLGGERFAESVLIRGGRVASIGERPALFRREKGDETVDCGGRTVIPGLNDACLSFSAIPGDGPFSGKKREARERLARGLRKCGEMGLTTVQLSGFPRELLPQLRAVCRGEGLPRVRLLLPWTGEQPRKLRLPRDRSGLAAGEYLLEGDRFSPEELTELLRRGEELGLTLRVRAEKRETAETALRAWHGRDGRLRRAALVCACPLTREQVRAAGETRLGVVGFPGSYPSALPAAAGERERVFPCRTLDALGAAVAFAGGEKCAPFAALREAVTRPGGVTPQGKDLPSAERMTVVRALDAFTRGGAWMGYEEDFYGRLHPGYSGDLLVLDRDIFTCPPEEIGDVRPLLVMREGETLYRSGV